MEDNEHLGGLEENSLTIKQINIRAAYNSFKLAYESFIACHFSDSFDFWYHVNWQKANNRHEDQSLLRTALKESADLQKLEVKKTMTAFDLYSECLNICLIGRFADNDDVDFKELLSTFPEELLTDYDNSPRVDQDAFDEMKRLVVSDE